mgnify:CR=1 FL=1
MVDHIKSTDVKECLINRITLYNEINQGLGGTLKIYNGLEKTENKLVTYSVAITKLFDIWGTFLDNLKKLT